VVTDAQTAAHLTSPEIFDLDARVKSLQAWDVVIRWQDKAKTEADFIRTRDRFQLTSEAADLHRWLRRVEDGIRARRIARRREDAPFAGEPPGVRHGGTRA
jgi:hypothetical protein